MNVVVKVQIGRIWRENQFGRSVVKSEWLKWLVTIVLGKYSPGIVKLKIEKMNKYTVELV